MSEQHRPRIDFYKLHSQNSSSIDRFCCQLSDKVVKLGHSVFVSTENERHTQLLDDMMWTFSDSSFLPHARQDDNADRDTPVIIGHREPASPGYLLITSAADYPSKCTTSSESPKS